MNIRVAIASEINSHAEQATAKANEAMHHAVEAGKLLLEVKASLPHGQFGEWLETNVKVSPRQAQRYMAAAEGKPVPIRSLSSKYDTVSHSTDTPTATSKTVGLTDWPVPTWTPTPGHWMTAATDEAAWWVVPSLEHPDFFHISKFHKASQAKPDPSQPDWDGESLFDGTRRPVRADVVEPMLQYFGMQELIHVEWISHERPGLSRPFGEPTPPEKF